MMTRTLYLSLILITGCNQSSFSANGKKSAQAPATDTPTSDPIRSRVEDPNTTTPPTIPESCNENGGTIANFLTKNLRNGANSQTVDIAMTLADCNGTPRSLAGQTLYFDTECATTDINRQTLPYTIKTADGSKTIASGVLASADGDLWGKNRSDFYYFYTQAVTYNEAVSRVILSIQFGHSLNCANVNGSKNDREVAPFMFRIGDAAPTKQSIDVLH